MNEKLNLYYTTHSRICKLDENTGNLGWEYDGEGVDDMIAELSQLKAEREAWKQSSEMYMRQGEEIYSQLLQSDADNANLIDILTRIEFVGRVIPECPVCRFEKPSHAEDCELYAALNPEKGTQ